VPIAESDVSILIPTYKYRDKVVRAVESALASGAGEVIVTDDAGHDGTVERLAQYSDPRLRVSENSCNLGLWENHLHALSLASRPWIKFIQADDYLLPGGLAAYAAAVEEGVTVVFGAPTVRDDATGELSYYHHIAAPRRASPAELQIAFLYGGWVLGSPSHMMLRADAIERDPAAWKTTISSDLVVGAIAAARGDTMLLPIGAIGQGSHPGQDARTQNAALGLERMVSSLAYLRRRQEPGLRWLANMWTWLQLQPALKTVARGLVRRESPPGKLVGYPQRLLASVSLEDWREIYANRELLRSAAHFRKTVRPPFDLPSLLDPGIPRQIMPRAA
jgi:Glycosyl transferase family 2